MNERIGKLAVKAGAYWDHGDWNMPSSVYFSERDLEKFAELVIDECCLKLLDMDQKVNGNHNYYKHAAIEIKRSFK
jgi:hypothetical protein